jgi:phosphate transport system substrate-binding protein
MPSSTDLSNDLHFDALRLQACEFFRHAPREVTRDIIPPSLRPFNEVPEVTRHVSSISMISLLPAVCLAGGFRFVTLVTAMLMKPQSYTETVRREPLLVIGRLMKKIIAVIALLSVLGFASIPESTIHIQGAGTLILLSQRWAQIYSQKRPQTKIVIQGGNPQAAMKSLSSEQATVVQTEGTAGGPGISFPVGVEGIAVYVNQSNPINQLTLEQLKGIFLGDITNWKQVGGSDSRIVLYAGESSTGVLPYFQEVVLHDAEPYPFEGKASAKELVDTVASNPEAIGYSSIYPTAKVKVLRIQASSTSAAVEATIENIRTRKYPISRYVYWHLAGKPTGELKAFVEWVLSSEGQLVVEGVGYEPLTSADRASGLAKLQ